MSCRWSGLTLAATGRSVPWRDLSARPAAVMKSPAGPGRDLIGAWPQPASSQSCPPGPTGDDPRPPAEEEKVMTSLPADPPGVIVGVETHQDVLSLIAIG